MDRIRIDLTHALESSLGQGKGIRAAELEECASAAAAALRALSARRASTSAWLDVAAASREHERILEWAEGLRGRFRALVVLNVGGSALAVQALRTALNSPFHNLTMPGGLPRLIVLDNVDPDLVGEFLDCVDPAECLFHVVSHSGRTSATLAQFLLVREVLRERLGEEAHKDRLVVSTREDGGALAAIAAEEGYERFAIPAGISARFAALTPVALLPAALLGIDTPGLVAGAQAMSELCLSEDLSANPALAWAACSVLLATRHAKSIEVTLSYSHRLRDLAPWGARLVAECLGQGRTRSARAASAGPTPLSAVGVTDQHTQLAQWLDGPRDKWVTTLSVERPDHALAIPRAFAEHAPLATLGGRSFAELFAAERDGTRCALAEAGVPQLDVRFPAVNAHLLGQYFQLRQTAVALAAEWLDLDADATSALERVRSASAALLGAAGLEQRRAAVQAWAARDARCV